MNLSAGSLPLKRTEEVLKLDKVPIRAIVFQKAGFPTLRSVKPTQWIS